MNHDPFCKAYYPDLLEVERCAWCMVIRRVREDERLNAYGNGYTDAIADDIKISSLKNSVEDLDVVYWRGYNNAITEMYMNEDNYTMSANEDIEVTYMSKKNIIKRWNELFDANPWLEGMTHADSCEFIDCCPVPEPEDWVAFNEVFNLMFLADIGSPEVLTRSFMDKIGGTQ
jgi:hypothetical protein